jgi:predicted RecA/RadA family phage recombinase
MPLPINGDAALPIPRRPTMPQAVFVHEGAAIDYTPTADVASGDVVVQGDLIGVAKLDIKANVLGALAVDGVFDFAKLTTVAYAVGTILYWDDTNNVVTTTATGNKQIGKAVRAAALADPTVRVKVTQ